MRLGETAEKQFPKAGQTSGKSIGFSRMATLKPTISTIYVRITLLFTGKCRK